MTPEVSINLRPRYSVAVSLAAPGGVLVLKPPQDTLLAELQAIMRGPRGPAYPSEAAQAATEAARDAAIAAQGDAEAAQGDAEAAQAAAEAARDAAAGSALSAGNSATAASGSATAAAGSAATAGTQAGIAATKAAEAAASAATANTKAGEASGSAASALAIYGNTAAMNTALSNAQAAASAAAGSAASAASVLQQDLSAISAALHRSPNAITAMFIYDTSKDSDGGAWVEKCQHTSWYNEPLCGKWLGAQASEAAARAVSGATTGDYFQLTTDGKFYKLAAGAGVVEVARGNKAKFPRLAAIVAEAYSFTIYDLSEAGRPMWMRFVGTGTSMPMMSTGYPSTCLSMLNGKLVIGSLADLNVLDFPKDSAKYYSSLVGYKVDYQNSIGQRSIQAKFVENNANSLVNRTVNAVAMTVLPDAPTDVVTGLKVPTIALATNGGISVIKHDGTVVNSMNTSAHTDVSIGRGSRFELRTGGNNNGFHHQSAGPIGALTPAFNYVILASPLAYTDFWKSGGSTGKSVSAGETFAVGWRGMATNPVVMSRGYSAINKPIVSTIYSTYSTGHLPGDIRRCYLSDTVVESVSNPATQPDRSYKAASATVYGTLTKSLTASANQLVAYSGFSAANYLREPYSADLDFGTGEWSVGAFVNIPKVMPTSAFPVISSELFSNGDFSGGATGWTVANADATHVVAFSGGTMRFQSGTTTPQLILEGYPGMTVGKHYKLSVVTSAWAGGLLKSDTLITGSGAPTYFAGEVGTQSQIVRALSTLFNATRGAVGTDTTVDSFSIVEVGDAVLAERGYSSGAYIRWSVNNSGQITAKVFDGTTTRTVTTDGYYNTGTFLKVVVNYRAGRLAIEVNGVEVVVSTGTPLQTLNNSNAVLTIGNSYALDAPFPGSIALLKLGATVPTPEQSLWMYEQEKMMFRDGAQITLPSSGAVVDLTYDEAQDKWVALQATHESSWTGLVRTAVATPSAGSFSKVAAAGGIKLQARTTTSPGVDITMPPLGLREELVRRAEAAAAQSRTLQVFDFDAVGFTAAMTNGSPTVTASSVVGTPYVGMGVTGTGVPANTTILGINGTTYTLSANCTATASNAVAQSTFTLTPGWTATEVIAASASKREGATKDWVRLYDGFRETVRFAVSPGSAALVQITARKDA